jgi:hypothetical protein
MKIHKTVHSHELETATHDGWALEQIVTSSHVDSHRNYAEARDPNSFYNTAQTYQEQAFRIDVPLFLVSKEAEAASREALLTEQLAQLHAQRVEAVNVLETERVAHRKTQDTLKNVQESVEFHKTREDNVRKDADSYKQDAATNRAQLAKIRVAIGEIRYKEILEG